jgi:hypothetical protein
MRLPNTAHTTRQWRIHEFTRDFRLEDVWALPTSGGPDDFPRLVRQMAAGAPRGPSVLARSLWAIRWWLGKLLDWDRRDTSRAPDLPTLHDRLPVDLREGPAGPAFDTLPFRSLYLTGNEWAAEIVNSTVHGVMHVGWVPDGAGCYRGQMAVLVKPNGLLGSLYMSFIKPLRYMIIYPALMREIAHDWRHSDVGRESGQEQVP